MTKHPRDKYLTVFGRKPVIEALNDGALKFGELLVDRQLNRKNLGHLLESAQNAGVKPVYCAAKKVHMRSKNTAQDQGVALDIETPQVEQLSDWSRLNADGALFLPDGVNTPANLGMMIRSTSAAALSGLVLPLKGCPGLTPLVVKASAGTVFHTTILKSASSEDAVRTLKSNGWCIYGLDSRGNSDLFTMTMSPRSVWVFGNETNGLSPEVSQLVDHWVSIPMAAGVESLNVAMSATVVAFEQVRRRRSPVS